MTRRQKNSPSVVPPFVVALTRIGETPTTGAARAALLATVKWCNYTTGEFWASMESWSKLAGIDVRTLQRLLPSLVELKIVEVVEASKGGASKTSVYRIPLFIVNPDATPGLVRSENPSHAPTTPATTATNPDVKCEQPRRHTTQNTNEQPEQTPTTPSISVDAEFLLRLGMAKELLLHHNASPERLAFAASEAPKKNDPAAWAASCIRDGYPIPARQPQAKPGEKAAQARARVEALPQEQARVLLAQVRRAYPNLAGESDGSAAVVGAMARLLGNEAQRGTR